MRDWTEILNDKIKDAEMPLPDNDWEWFEAKFRQRRRIAFLRWSLYSIAAAILSITLLPFPDKQQNNERLPYQTAYSGKMPVADTSSDRSITVKHQITKTSRQTTLFLEEENKISSEIHRETQDVPQVIKVTADTECAYDVKQTAEDENNSYHSFETQKTKKTRTALSLSASLNGSFGAFRKNTVSFHNSSQPLYSLAQFASGNSFADLSIRTTHSLPITYGLNISFPFNDLLSLTTGLDISKYKSVFTPDESIFKKQTYVQKAYYLGIPLRLDINLWERNCFSIWAGVGGKIDRLVYGILDNNTLNDNAFHFSAIANLGMKYELFDNVYLYCTPQMSLYFRPDIPNIATYRTETPLYVSLDVGVSLDL